MTGNSKLKATNNGYSGVWTRVLNLDPTCSLYVENNGTKAFSTGTNPGIFFQGNGKFKSEIAKGATVVIRNNTSNRKPATLPLDQQPSQTTAQDRPTKAALALNMAEASTMSVR